MKLKLTEFMKNNENWEQILRKAPYCLKIKRDDGYILLRYDQTASDFSEEMVREARGIIVREDTLEVVCFPFVKFFNVDEPYADEIDWSTAQVQEKMDGSLIKVWCDKDKYGIPTWHISTNSMIDAFGAKIDSNITKYKTYGELFMSAFDNSYLTQMNRNYTYMFELVSPYNKVIVSYPITDIYHIGTRNNKTGNELNLDIGIKKPKVFDLKTEQEVKNAANALPFDEEGYVVVDANYNRVKIKSPAYVNAHKLVSDVAVNESRVLDMIRKNEKSEFLSYFPEFTKDIQELEREYNKFLEKMRKKSETIIRLRDKRISRKDFALTVMRKYDDVADMAFMLYDGKIKDSKEFLENFSSKKILERMRR